VEAIEPSESGSRGEAVLLGLARATPGRPIALGRYDVIGTSDRVGWGRSYEALDASAAHASR